MTRVELRDGWVGLMERLYDPEHYSARFAALFVEGRLPLGTAKMTWLRRHRPLSYLKAQALTILSAVGILARLWCLRGRLAAGAGLGPGRHRGRRTWCKRRRRCPLPRRARPWAGRGSPGRPAAEGSS
jgi:hypothetical protein